MDSERLSGEYWDQVPHIELYEYASAEKTKADVAALECFPAKNDKILDPGCGWSRITCELALIGFDVAGVDLSENLIAYARQYAKDLNIGIPFDVGSMLEFHAPTSILTNWFACGDRLTIS